MAYQVQQFTTDFDKRQAVMVLQDGATGITIVNVPFVVSGDVAESVVKAAATAAIAAQLRAAADSLG